MPNQKGANASYLRHILEGIRSSYTGLRLTFRHLWQAFRKRKPVGIAEKNYFEQTTGMVTLQYPAESFPVPDNGRYRLYNEIEDCIVCDLCAKICPVNCIEIEPVKATEEIGKTSDGTTKRIYAAKFDIDMAKCCYCGLCTTVCPTECLTMTKAYDYSETDVRNMVYHFTDLSPVQAEQKKLALAEFQKVAKAKPPKIAAPLNPENQLQDPLTSVVKVKEDEGTRTPEVQKNPAPKIPFKPVIKTTKKEEEPKDNTKKLDLNTDVKTADENKTSDVSPKNFKPVIKPIIKKDGGEKISKTGEEPESKENPSAETPLKPKPFKPVIKPPFKKQDNSEKGNEDPKS